MLVSLPIWLLWSLLKRDQPSKSYLPSFRFSELKETPIGPARVIHTQICGVSFQNRDGVSRQELIRSCCRPGDALLLLRDRHNSVDPNAVGIVRICRGSDGKATFGDQIGYLSKELALDLSHLFSDAPLGFAEILDVTGHFDDLAEQNFGVNIRAEIYVSEEYVPHQQQLSLPLK